MKKDSHVTAFYLEVLLLTVCLIGIVLVLTKVFALGRMESGSARELTDAVCLAQNAAEAFSASDSPEELCAFLDENGNAKLLEAANTPTVRAAYDAALQPNPVGALVLTVTWEEDTAEPGRLVHGTITVRAGENGRELYSLQTAVYLKEEAA